MTRRIPWSAVLALAACAGGRHPASSGPAAAPVGSDGTPTAAGPGPAAAPATEALEPACAGDCAGEAVRDAIREVLPVVRACFQDDAAEVTPSTLRCQCAALCAARFPATEGARRVSYPLSGADQGLYLDIDPTGRVRRCGWDRVVAAPLPCDGAPGGDGPGRVD